MVSGYFIVQCRFRFYKTFISEFLYARVMWTFPSVIQMNFVDYEFLKANS